MPRRIYVETLVRGRLTDLWELTQQPAEHERWDLRFHEISPVPDAPHRFRYAIRLPGLVLAGDGISVGERVRPDGTRTSALRFASKHPLSPIRSGSGYWRYVPEGSGVR